MQALMTIEAAAASIGVPKASLRSAAERHGFLIRIGRAIRIDPNQLPELLRKCQSAPKDHAFTGTNQEASGSSETRGAQKLRQAQATAARLKSGSRNISQGGTEDRQGRVIRLPS